MLGRLIQCGRADRTLLRLGGPFDECSVTSNNVFRLGKRPCSPASSRATTRENCCASRQEAPASATITSCSAVLRESMPQPPVAGRSLPYLCDEQPDEEGA